MGNLIDDIKKSSRQNGKTRVYFDMDGVLAFYGEGDKGPKEVKHGFFSKKKPLTETIEFAESLLQIPNVDVFILSNCYYKCQAEEKVEWLEIYAPFIKKENIKIICYEDFDLNKVNKRALKAEYLAEIFKQTGDAVFMIDDDPRILEEIGKKPEINGYHVKSVDECLKIK